MTKQRLTELIETYGADPERWPDDERMQALAYMGEHPLEYDQILADAKSLDQILDFGKSNVTDTSLLAARIFKSANVGTETPHAPANDRIIPWRKSTWKSVAATFVVTTGLGFAAGQSATAKSDRLEMAEALLSLELEIPYTSDDLLEDMQ